MSSAQIIGLILGSSLLSTIFGKVFDYITARKKTDQILLLEAIERQSDKMVSQGHRSHNQTQRIQEAYAQYKKLGGDGYADSLLSDAMKTPIKD